MYHRHRSDYLDVLQAEHRVTDSRFYELPTLGPMQMVSECVRRALTNVGAVDTSRPWKQRPFISDVSDGMSPYGIVVDAKRQRYVTCSVHGIVLAVDMSDKSERLVKDATKRINAPLLASMLLDFSGDSCLILNGGYSDSSLCQISLADHNLGCVLHTTSLNNVKYLKDHALLSNGAYVALEVTKREVLVRAYDYSRLIQVTSSTGASFTDHLLGDHSRSYVSTYRMCASALSDGLVVTAHGISQRSIINFTAVTSSYQVSHKVDVVVPYPDDSSECTRFEIQDTKSDADGNIVALLIDGDDIAKLCVIRADGCLLFTHALAAPTKAGDYVRRIAVTPQGTLVGVSERGGALCELGPFAD
jgi:hypothetical protein